MTASDEATLRDIFANRFYVAYAIAFFAVWGLASAIASIAALDYHWAVMAGIIASTVLERLAEWMHEWRSAEQEVDAHGV